MCVEDPNSKQDFEAKTHLLQFRNFPTLKFHPFCSLTLPATQFCPCQLSLTPARTACIPLSFCSLTKLAPLKSPACLQRPTASKPEVGQETFIIESRCAKKNRRNLFSPKMIFLHS